MKLLFFQCNIFLCLLCKILNQIIKVSLAELVLRLNVSEDDFVESRSELVV
jgi:hypothetical protein